MVEKYCELSDYLQAAVQSHPKLEMMSERSWSNICFRYVVKGHDLNEVNTELRSRLMREGIHLVSRSNIHDQVVIRAVVANPLVDQSVLDGLVAAIVRHGDEIVDGVPPQF
jgi:glutamate/tyrosine decarboxylase-like PLP-dependent enzyme